MKKTSLYLPIMDNGGDTGRIGWAVSMMALCGSKLFRDRKVIIQPFSYPYPDGNANIATTSFLESGCDEMVIIDADVIFSPIHMEWLLSHDVGLVGGIVPKKKLGLEYSIIPLKDNVDPFSGPNDLCEVEVVCRAFMRIRREVFEMLNTHPDVVEYDCLETGRKAREYWKNISGGTSDDFTFCRRYRAVGGKVYVDRRCTLRHAGNIVYPIDGTYPLIAMIPPSEIIVINKGGTRFRAHPSSRINAKGYKEWLYNPFKGAFQYRVEIPGVLISMITLDVTERELRAFLSTGKPVVQLNRCYDRYSSVLARNLGDCIAQFPTKARHKGRELAHSVKVNSTRDILQTLDGGTRDNMSISAVAVKGDFGDRPPKSMDDFDLFVNDNWIRFQIRDVPGFFDPLSPSYTINLQSPHKGIE